MWFSFKNNSNHQEVQKVTRRIIDATVNMHREDSRRVDRRAMRQLPVFVAAHGDNPVGPITNGITRDISDTGLSLLVPEKLEATEVVILLLFDDEPKFFLGSVCQNRPFGAGFWQLGVSLTELLDPLDNAIAQRLLPLVPHLRGEPAAVV